MKRLASAELPTENGTFEMMAFGHGLERFPHVAMVHQASKRSEVLNPDDVVLVRIHSECMTGDVFGSQRCECGDQLEMALKAVGSAEVGILVYLRQEGRGIGLVEKLKAYNLQDEGLNTFEANVALGHAPDERDFSDAITILRSLGVTKIRLLTNNPQKVEAFHQTGIEVVERLPLQATVTPENSAYLEAKRQVGHLLKG